MCRRSTMPRSSGPRRATGMTGVCSFQASVKVVLFLQHISIMMSAIMVSPARVGVRSSNCDTYRAQLVATAGATYGTSIQSISSQCCWEPALSRSSRAPHDARNPQFQIERLQPPA
jgi:hypothetical protein